MADVATTEFLSYLKSLYPTPTPETGVTEVCTIDNPWYISVVSAFSAANRPDAMPNVYEYIMKELGESSSLEDKQRLTTKIRDAILRSAMTSGYARAINSLVALYDVTPEELRGTAHIRNTTSDQLADLQARGKDFFAYMYGNNATSVQGLLDNVYPDMGFVTEALAYGYVYLPNELISAKEMAFILVSTLISMDTPRQVGWHLASSLRAGASLLEACAIRRIAMEVASKCGIVWRDGVPDVAEA